MSIFEAIVLGLIQGFTEFIPVSSSGHLLLAHELFDTGGSSLVFDVALHVGTLAALVLYFRSDIYELGSQVSKETQEGRLARILIVATIPAAIIGLLFDGFIEDNLRSNVVVAVSLAAVGLLMLVADKRFKEKPNKEVSQRQGIVVGCAQALALIPGVSRSGITITAGIFMGMSRMQAARFSFLLAIPIITGSAIGIFLRQGIESDSKGVIAAWMLAAFASGLLAIRFLLSVIAKTGLKPFAIYRIILAVIVIVFLV